MANPSPLHQDTIDDGANGRPNSNDSARWHSDLKRLPIGKVLIDHLGAMAYAYQDKDNRRYDCSIADCTLHLRAFIRAWSQNPNAFALPDNPPKYIAIVNLSGKRAMLTTNKPYLFVDLVGLHGLFPTSGEGCGVASALKAMVTHCDKTPGMSLLLVYSMPFQVGIEHLHWDVRTIQRFKDGRVVDGQLCYNAVQSGRGNLPHCTTPTAFNEAPEQSETLACIAQHMQNQYVAQNIDVCANDDDEYNSQAEEGNAANTRNAAQETLKEICTRLQMDRKTLQKQHCQEIEALAEKWSKKLHDTRMMQSEAYKRERQLESELRTKLMICEEKAQANLQLADHANASLEELHSELHHKELLWAEERNEHLDKCTKLEHRVATYVKRVAELNNTHTRVVDSVNASALKHANDAEQRYTEAREEEAKARRDRDEMHERVVAINALLDRNYGISDTLKHQMRQWQLTAAVYKTIVAYHAQRITNGSKCNDDKVATRAITMVDASTETQPISSKADFEFGRLCAEHVKLQEKLDTTKAELNACKMQLDKVETTGKHGLEQEPKQRQEQEQEQGPEQTRDITLSNTTTTTTDECKHDFFTGHEHDYFNASNVHGYHGTGYVDPHNVNHGLKAHVPHDASSNGLVYSPVDVAVAALLPQLYFVINTAQTATRNQAAAAHAHARATALEAVGLSTLENALSMHSNVTSTSAATHSVCNVPHVHANHGMRMMPLQPPLYTAVHSSNCHTATAMLAAPSPSPPPPPPPPLPMPPQMPLSPPPPSSPPPYASQLSHCTPPYLPTTQSSSSSQTASACNSTIHGATQAAMYRNKLRLSHTPRNNNNNNNKGYTKG